jgi:FkbM family methyltransferase
MIPRKSFSIHQAFSRSQLSFLLTALLILFCLVLFFYQPKTVSSEVSTVPKEYLASRKHESCATIDDIKKVLKDSIPESETECNCECEAKLCPPAPPAPAVSTSNQIVVAANAPRADWQYLTADQASSSARLMVTLPGWLFQDPNSIAVPNFPVDYSKATAQSNEDTGAYHSYFWNKRDGLMLESGALDGKHLSTTSFFVYGLGWRAIHIEPSPLSYQRLIENRPESLNINSAMCKETRSLRYAIHPEHPAVNGIWEFMSNDFKNAWYKGFDPSSFPMINCRPFSSLMALFGITHIDFWILDTEGAEYEVIQTVDFSKIQIDVIAVEADGRDQAKDNAVRQHLLANGYRLDISGDNNDWFVRNDFVPQRKQ